MPKIHPKNGLTDAVHAEWRKNKSQTTTDFLGELGLAVIKALLESEVLELCGEKYERSKDRSGVRWGSEPGIATIRGAKESIDKPRVRSNGKEVQLQTYKSVSNTDALSDRMLTAIASGVSTRNYVRLLERAVTAKGCSKSSVSRRTIAASKPLIDEFLKRRLDGINIVAVFIDGINIGKRQMIVAIGVTSAGRKLVLGMRLGATENFPVCRDLLSDLIERGFPDSPVCLFVIDGSKALVRAIRSTFGDNTLIQRCQEHKIRNVLAYVPRKYHHAVRYKLQAAYSQRSLASAITSLDQIRAMLARISESAANALLEGMVETLTLIRLGIRGALYTSLRTTNIIEAAFSAARRHTQKSTRFRNEQQIYNWAARGLHGAEQNFRPLKGHRQAAHLQEKIATFDSTFWGL